MPAPNPPSNNRPTSVPNPVWWDPQQSVLKRSRKVQQVVGIRDAFQGQGNGVQVYPDNADPAGMDNLYEPRRLLVRTGQDASNACDALSIPPSSASAHATKLPGLSMITLPSSAAFSNIKSVVDHVEAVHPGIVSPDHVVHITPTAGGCPATEPVPVESPFALVPYPDRRSAVDARGAGIKVVVVDTGFMQGVAHQHPWLDSQSVTGDNEPGSVGHYRGHGTFVAGIVRALAPDAELHVLALMYRKGAILESELVRELSAALTFSPEIISISAGMTTLGDREPIGFQVFQEDLQANHPNTLVVAAAGNDGNTERFFPASFPWAVGVGALNPDLSLAAYSNRGDSADVYAEGTDLVNAYPKGNYTYEEDPRTNQHANFQSGLAVWSGTSFSAPFVTGIIAARASRPGKDVQSAWAELQVTPRDPNARRVLTAANI